MSSKIPIIPCDSKTKAFNSQWKNIDFIQIDFNSKLANGEYDNGIALVLGTNCRPFILYW